MPAQLIVIGRVDFTPEGRKTATTKGKQGTRKTGNPGAASAEPNPPPPPKLKYPPYKPFPAGQLSVFGQEPDHVGHFDKMSSLFKSLGRSKKIPGGASRTVFATVADVKGLQPKSIRQSLARLPDRLTIVVKPGPL